MGFIGTWLEVSVISLQSSDEMTDFFSFFLDWIKGGLGWVSNNIVKPVLGGFTWAKKNKFVQGGLSAAKFVGKYSGEVGKYANIADQIINKGDSVNQAYQAANGDLIETAKTYYNPAGGVTPQAKDLMQWKPS
jgi:hypothetical protein